MINPKSGTDTCSKKMIFCLMTHLPAAAAHMSQTSPASFAGLAIMRLSTCLHKQACAAACVMTAVKTCSVWMVRSYPPIFDKYHAALYNDGEQYQSIRLYW